MNVFYSLQQYCKKMIEKNHQVASGQYDIEKEKGEAKAPPSTTNLISK
jgi:hypothetical protein